MALYSYGNIVMAEGLCRGPKGRRNGIWSAKDQAGDEVKPHAPSSLRRFCGDGTMRRSIIIYYYLFIIIICGNGTMRRSIIIYYYLFIIIICGDGTMRRSIRLTSARSQTKQILPTNPIFGIN